MNRATSTHLLAMASALSMLMACAQTSPLSGGDADCAGVLGGDATVDACGVCEGDGSSCADCAGVSNGESMADECGVCNGDGSTCLDCDGITNGDSVADECGVCNGDDSTCLDCAGVPNGDAMLDECGVCNGDNSSCADCHGEPNGIAVIDACGVCGGDDSSCLDCAGTPNGVLIVDECGVCGGDNSSCLDCAGTLNGDLVFDECGICDGDGTSCLDCAGVPNGVAVVDECGVCDGDGSTCGDFVVVGVKADAFVSSSYSSTNYGSNEEVRVDRGYDETYLRFDLAESLPAGAVIHTVALQMWAYHGFAWGNDGTVYTYLVEDDTWGEYDINWANKPAFTGAHLGSWWLWYDYSDYSLKSARFETEAMAQAVQAELDGDGLMSLRQHSPGYRTNYRSREFSDETMRPRLEVVYDDCHGTPSGVAYLDSCDACVGGETGLEETTCPDDGTVDDGTETPDDGTTDDVNLGDETVVLSQQGSCGHGDVVAACSAGSVAVGYQGRTGYWFDHVRLYCQVLEADGTLGEASLSGQNGSSNGGNAAGPNLCPAGHVMVGGEVRAGDHLDYVRGHCLSVDDVIAGTSGYTASATGMGNPNGGAYYGSQVCPAGYAVSGMVGGNTQYACRISWQCSPIAP